MNIDDKTLMDLTKQNKKLNTLILDLAKVYSLNVKLEWRQIEYLSLRDSLIKRIDFLNNLPNIFYLDLYQNPIENYTPLIEAKTFGFLSFSSPGSYLEKRILCLHNINAIIIKVEIKDRSNYQTFIYKNPNVLIMNNSIVEFKYKIFFFKLIQRWRYYCKKLFNVKNGEKIEGNTDKEITSEMPEKEITKKFSVHKKQNTTNPKIKEIENFFEEFNFLMIEYYKNKNENILNGNIYKLERKKLIMINKTLFNVIKFNHNNEGLFKFTPNKKVNSSNIFLNSSIYYPNLSLNIFNHLTPPELKKISLSIILLKIFKIFSKDITLFLLTLIFMKTNYYKQNRNNIVKFDLMTSLKDFVNMKTIYLITSYYQIYENFYKLIDKKNITGIEKNLKIIYLTNRVMDIVNYQKVKNNANDFNEEVDYEIINDIKYIKNIKEFQEIFESTEMQKMNDVQKIQYLNNVIQNESSDVNYLKTIGNKNNNEVDNNKQNIDENTINNNDNKINNIKIKKSKINNIIKFFIKINVFDDLLNIIQYVNDFIIYNHLDKDLEHDFSDDIQFLISIKNNMFLFVSNKNIYNESFADKYFNKLQADNMLANRFFFKNEKIQRINKCYYNVFLNQRHRIFHPNKKKLTSFSKVKTLKQQLQDQEKQLKTEFIKNALNSFFVITKETPNKKIKNIGNSIKNCKSQGFYNSRNFQINKTDRNKDQNYHRMLSVSTNDRDNNYFNKYSNISCDKTVTNFISERKYNLNKLPNTQLNNLKFSYDSFNPNFYNKNLFLKTSNSPQPKKGSIFIPKVPSFNEVQLTSGSNLKYLINNTGLNNKRFSNFFYSIKENKNRVKFSPVQQSKNHKFELSSISKK